MAEQFLHGIETIERDEGGRPVETVKSAVIGLIGTAPDADPINWPLNTNILINGERGIPAGPTDAGGTLGDALDGIMDNASATVIARRVAEGETLAETFRGSLQQIQRRGRYAEILREYEPYFPLSSSLQLFPFEWIADRPKDLMDQIFGFIGVTPTFHEETARQRFASTSGARMLDDASRVEVAEYCREANEALRPHVWWSPEWL